MKCILTAAQALGYQLFVLIGKAAEYPVLKIVLRMRLFAYADLDARKLVGAAEIDDVLQSLLTSVRAFAAYTDSAYVQRDVI